MICFTQLSEVIATLEVIEVKGVNDLCNTCLNACQRIVNFFQVFPELIQYTFSGNLHILHPAEVFTQTQRMDITLATPNSET